MNAGTIDSSPVKTNRVIVFDTTLRDGDQTPGAATSPRTKLRTARLLERLCVDVIEAGFPASSEQDFQAVRAIASELHGSCVCALARCVEPDIERAASALAAAARPRIHVFIATSPIHRKHKLNMKRAQVLEAAAKGVRLAAAACADVEFSAEDATRTERRFLADVVETAIESGARTINIPDTVGYSTPDETAALFLWLREHVRGADTVIFSAHCHDDLGMAVANSLAALGAGARQVECTINGIGERAGNASLEEIVMALHTRTDSYGLTTNVRTELLSRASRAVSRATGIVVAPNKAVVGQNAFAHESGIHQHGMLRHRVTYEIMRPGDVGAKSSLVLGRHSGRHALLARLRGLGVQPAAIELEQILNALKAHKGNGCLMDTELKALAARTMAECRREWTLLNAESREVPQGKFSVCVNALTPEGVTRIGSAKAATLRRAVFKAVKRATQREFSATVKTLDLQARGDGQLWQAEVELVLDHTKASGQAWGTSDVEALAAALLQGASMLEPGRSKECKKFVTVTES
jgi:2-isopropylmalate synthase